ncbi:response regulator transcription factor [Nocardioides antri]|uniref:Response regulator transcription factor n=1 Tax=Nocardioides antri TaxID=2607659 RepID=A0A5B1LS19_9ACTN|nr:response regulator transcription factor [Nocardioides antri]KAA1423204.1 response regulator transcription factor [Nocardioides antri]
MRVLLVEDEAKLARLVARGLTERGDQVTIAGTGQEALDAAADDEGYDVILLDVRLPDMEGFEVCRRLRRSRVWTPVLMLTARNAVADRITGLDSGADDYLGKPFVFDELLARMRALARRGPVPRPTVLEVGDLRMDPASRRVWRGEEEIELSAREFALLEALMRRPEQVLSRDQLLAHAWGAVHDTSSNVVDVYVRYLREKIDRPFGAESLRTVRGLGYRLTGGEA